MNLKKLGLPFAALLLAAVIVAASVLLAQSSDSSTRITPADALKLVTTDSSAVVLDVRTPAEFKSETGHLANAILIPVQELEQRAGELTPYKERTILVYCRTGHRSTIAAEILQKHGFKALNMEGGITRWRSENLPTVQEPH